MKSVVERTVEECEERLKSYPNDLPTRERLAEALVAMKKPAQAADLYVSTAEAWEKAGRAPMAASLYHKALKLAPERTELVEKIQKLVPPKKR
ncbi:MAG TPA: hypothetical protein VGM39_07220 [Kofleriaceae bacterium]|jgi:Tfp pilus assembly protein PilF